MRTLLLFFLISVAVQAEIWEKPEYVPDENHLPNEEEMQKEEEVKEKQDKKDKKQDKELYKKIPKHPSPRDP